MFHKNQKVKRFYFRLLVLRWNAKTKKPPTHKEDMGNLVRQGSASSDSLALDFFLNCKEGKSVTMLTNCHSLHLIQEEGYL